jgi:glucose/arabinose dehydrogenase
MKINSTNVVYRFYRLYLLVCITVLLMLPSCQKSDISQLKNVNIQLIADGFVSPIQLVPVPDGSERLFVIDQIGKVWIIDKDGKKLSTPFIDVSSKLVSLNPAYDERGLLGLAFHADYRNNGRFYIYYQIPPRAGGPASGVSWNNLTRISEFRVSSDPNRADLNTEKVLLDIDDPQFNHNGGTLVYHERYLFISIGDGGGANDTAAGHVQDWYAVNKGGNAQNIEANLFGKILRIDVNTGNPYGIPPDNPFVNTTGRDEIYAYGFRNPYRFSIDSQSHQLLVGDAGQVLWEEIDVVKKGGNYGWNVREGLHCFNAANNLNVLNSCPSIDSFGNQIRKPVIEINNWQNPQGGRATTIIGGHVYRGTTIPAWYGKYIFGTFSQTPTTANGELFAAIVAGHTDQWQFEEVSLQGHPDDIGYYLKGFGQDLHGEIYLTVSSLPGPTGNTGKVFKLVPGNP